MTKIRYPPPKKRGRPLASISKKKIIFFRPYIAIVNQTNVDNVMAISEWGKIKQLIAIMIMETNDCLTSIFILWSSILNDFNITSIYQFNQQPCLGLLEKKEIQLPYETIAIFKILYNLTLSNYNRKGNGMLKFCSNYSLAHKYKRSGIF